MEINSLGTLYLENYRFANTANPSEDTADKAYNFAETLKKTASAAPRKAGTIDKTSKLYEQCLELETFLVKNLISSMRNTVQKSGLVDEGFAGKMYEDMLYDEYAKDFTRSANLGFAEQIYRELTGQRDTVVIRS